METVLKPKSANFTNNSGGGGSSNHKSRLARTFQKVISLRSATKIGSSNGMGMCVMAQAKCQQQRQQQDDDDDDDVEGEDSSKVSKVKQKAVLEALLAKVFASVTCIKAAYAELQMAQHPYNGDAIQAADQAVVEQLRALSELKRKFIKKDLLHLSPQVTLMLAEIQEQQSLMRTYEITINKLESDVEHKDSRIASLRKQLQHCSAFNKSLEKKLHLLDNDGGGGGPSAVLSIMFDNINRVQQLRALKPSHFVRVLHCTMRSVRSFVKMMIKEMEAAKWDLDAAAKTIEPGALLAKPTHRCFVFESFVFKTMLQGFADANYMHHHHHHDFGVGNSTSNSNSNSSSNCAADDDECRKRERQDYFQELKAMAKWWGEPAGSLIAIVGDPSSSFGKFSRSKYLNLVHAKMECSFFGNLNQRKLLLLNSNSNSSNSATSTSSGFPDTAFFRAFAEMARRFWLLHCLAFSLHERVSLFQVNRGCRFSEVYMENVMSDDESIFNHDDHPPNSNSNSNSNIVVDNIRVSFTVVPGFKIGTSTVIQSQVYLSPIITPPSASASAPVSTSTRN